MHDSKEVTGYNKERDLLILYGLASGLTQQEVGDKVQIHRSVVSKIASHNFDLLNKITMQAELAKKAGRLRFAFRVLQKRDRVTEGDSKKDSLDWLDYIRKEIEGDKTAVQVNIQQNIIYQASIDNSGRVICQPRNDDKDPKIPIIEDKSDKTLTRIAPDGLKTEGQ